MKIFIWAKTTYKHEGWWYDGSCIAVAESIEDAYIIISSVAAADEMWEFKDGDVQIYNLEGDYSPKATLIRATR